MNDPLKMMIKWCVWQIWRTKWFILGFVLGVSYASIRYYNMLVTHDWILK